MGKQQKRINVDESSFMTFEKTVKYRKAALDAVNEIYEQNLKGVFGEGDPNHPKYNEGYDYSKEQFVSLFGYEQREFMRKQYKDCI